MPSNSPIAPSSVQEIIEQLQKMPPNSHVYFRPKYYGEVQKTENVPLNKSNISEMNPNAALYPDEPSSYVVMLG